MIEVHAPDTYSTDKPIIFLAGSIEQGTATNWQEDVVRSLNDLDVTVLNPRRLAWDATWEEREHNPQFKQQVEWELSGQEQANLILMYLEPNTKSPISLLELGLFHKQHILVCCPEGFWRQGNVEIICHRYHIPLFETLDGLIAETRRRFG